jgi:hypothetical protein
VVLHIQSTFNNTIVTITNLTGDTISWASAGSAGFKGARKVRLLPLKRLLKSSFRSTKYWNEKC